MACLDKRIPKSAAALSLLIKTKPWYGSLADMNGVKFAQQCTQGKDALWNSFIDLFLQENFQNNLVSHSRNAFNFFKKIIEIFFKKYFKLASKEFNLGAYYFYSSIEE